MHPMKYLALLLLALTCSTAFAYDVLRDDVYYNLNKEEKTASVTYRRIVPGRSRTEYYNDIVIPETIKVKGVQYQVTAIGDSAFFGCDEVNIILLPCSITHIGKSAFENFNYKYGDSFIYNSCCSIESIGERAFANSTLRIGHEGNQLTNNRLGYLGDLVTHIGKEAFLNSMICGFIVNENVRTIGDAAFQGCEQMEVIDIRDLKQWCDINFESMYSNPLAMAHNIFRNLRKDPMMFSLDSLVATLTLPDGITALKPYAFVRANIKELFLPNTLSQIGSYAFYECQNLLTVHLPASVEKIAVGAFSGCLQLQTISIDNPNIIIEPANFSTFNGQLIVKPGMAEKFQQNPLWKNCTIIER